MSKRKEKKLHDNGICNEFLDITPKAQATNPNNLIGLYKTKKLCTAKEIRDPLRNRIKYLQIMYLNKGYYSEY